MGEIAVIDAGLETGDRLVTSQPEPAIEGMLTRPVADHQGEHWLATREQP